MPSPDAPRTPGFYFSLPRLLAGWSGGTGDRTENNSLEAHLVGALVHLVAYLFAFQLLLADSPIWQLLFLLLPFAALVWLGWLIVLYLNSWVIKLLRLLGLLRNVPDNRAQSLVIGVMTTWFAWRLIVAGHWPGLVGAIWIAAVALNLSAAVVLTLIHADSATGK